MHAITYLDTVICCNVSACFKVKPPMFVASREALAPINAAKPTRHRRKPSGSQWGIALPTGATHHVAPEKRPQPPRAIQAGATCTVLRQRPLIEVL
mmetsp:Transcript_64339/g.140050  ORF Transcript_64339/g.140050 Transcript_64339/m.140050 type:complete len:96 (+) Transcript_64339:214-501(+)